MFHYVKVAIKEAIRRKYGTIAHFVKMTNDKDLTESKVSLALNPSTNCTLNKLTEICEYAGLELDIREKTLFKKEKK